MDAKSRECGPSELARSWRARSDGRPLRWWVVCRLPAVDAFSVLVLKETRSAVSKDGRRRGLVATRCSIRAAASTSWCRRSTCRGARRRHPGQSPCTSRGVKRLGEKPFRAHISIPSRGALQARHVKRSCPFLHAGEHFVAAFCEPVEIVDEIIPCNPVNYRAGTGATCKQQEKSRLPVKGENYREPSSSIWTG
jgi:hypothetical protein